MPATTRSMTPTPTPTAAAAASGQSRNTTTKGGGGGTSIRVTTYNVLSSRTWRNRRTLRRAIRKIWTRPRGCRVQEKLRNEVKKRSIIGLQEVSMTWSGPLHAFFAKHGYHVVSHFVCGSRLIITWELYWRCRWIRTSYRGWTCRGCRIARSGQVNRRVWRKREAW